MTDQTHVPTPGVQRSGEAKPDPNSLPQGEPLELPGKISGGGPENSGPITHEEFARCVVDRGFRLVEVGALVGLDAGVVAARLLEPEVQAHLARLVTTGEAAQLVVGPRELQEIVSRAARMTFSEYREQCRAGKWGADVNAAEYWGIRLRACELEYKILVGPQKPGQKKGYGRGRRPVSKAVAKEIVVAEVVK